MLFESRTSFMGSGLDRIFGQVVSTRMKTLRNANLVVSSQIIIKGKGISPGWLASLREDLALNFPGDRPAQRECARTGLGSHARCHPYPIPQPVKVGHTTGVYDPYSFRIVMWVLLRPTRTNQWKCCETGPTVFRPYPRRLESLTICRCHFNGSTFFSVI